jgi:hypothetical protein
MRGALLLLCALAAGAAACSSLRKDCEAGDLDGESGCVDDATYVCHGDDGGGWVLDEHDCGDELDQLRSGEELWVSLLRDVAPVFLVAVGTCEEARCEETPDPRCRVDCSEPCPEPNEANLLQTCEDSGMVAACVGSSLVARADCQSMQADIDMLPEVSCELAGGETVAAAWAADASCQPICINGLCALDCPDACPPQIDVGAICVDSVWLACGAGTAFARAACPDGATCSGVVSFWP